jgi:peroxidase
MPFVRNLPPIYENGFNTPVGWDVNRLYFGYRKPNARSVTLQLVTTDRITPHHQLSSMVMQWGQFLGMITAPKLIHTTDHDIDFTAQALSRQTFATGAICNRTCEHVDPCFNIPLPVDDPRRNSRYEGGIKTQLASYSSPDSPCPSPASSSSDLVPSVARVRPRPSSAKSPTASR